MISLDPTDRALEKARDIGAQMIITHHPLLFRPVTTMNLLHVTPRLIAELIKSEIALASAHTNLDSAKGGVSDILAQALGLEELVPLVPHPERPAEGLGRVGILPEPSPLDSLAKKLADYLAAPAFSMVGEPDRKIQRVAVCGGSGSDLWPQVISSGAELYITGEIKHHLARDAEAMKVALIDAGHFYTERPVTRYIATKLREAATEQGWELNVQVFQEEEAPLRLWSR